MISEEKGRKLQMLSVLSERANKSQELADKAFIEAVKAGATVTELQSATQLKAHQLRYMAKKNQLHIVPDKRGAKQ